MKFFNKINDGITLIELMCVLAILEILMTISMPLWRNFIVEQRMDFLMHRLIMAIHYSRVSAIERDEAVQLCGSTDLKTCDGNWNAGMITRIARNQEIIRQYGGWPQKYHLLWRSSLGYNQFLNFSAEGLTQGQQGTFYLCPPDHASSGRKVIINHSGRLRLERAPVYASCSF